MARKARDHRAIGRLGEGIFRAVDVVHHAHFKSDGIQSGIGKLRASVGKVTEGYAGGEVELRRD